MPKLVGLLRCCPDGEQGGGNINLFVTLLKRPRYLVSSFPCDDLSFCYPHADCWVHSIYSPVYSYIHPIIQDVSSSSLEFLGVGFVVSSRYLG